MFFSSKRREVVKATLEFVKVTIGVLPASELLPHVEELVCIYRGEGMRGGGGERENIVKIGVMVGYTDHF